MASIAAALQSVSYPSLCRPSSQGGAFSSSGASLSLRRPQNSNRRFQICCEAKPETVTKVIEIVTRQLAVKDGAVFPHSKFTELGADSLDQVEIVMALEEEFKISVDEDGAEAIHTVQDAADLIDRTTGKKA